MSSEKPDDPNHVDDAGASTDQHVTDRAEAGDPLVDRAPVSTTPAHGSSNKGVNTTRANRVD